MDSIKDFFTLLVWIAIILGVIALVSYNKLQRLAQEIREKSSNVQVAISRKLSLINQLIDVVKNFQESEQFTHLKIAQDSSTANLMSAYQASGTVLASLQGMAQRFPDLKNSEQYHRLVDSIQTCESDVQMRRQGYNAAVKEYNSVCLSIPTVLVARLIGFSKAPYLEFDLSGVNDVTSLKDFKTDDGERLQQLLSSAGGSVAGATRVLAGHATQTGKFLVERAKERSAIDKPDPIALSYFYMIPGGVPQGPAFLSEIQGLVAQGSVDATVLVAAVGSQDWKPLTDQVPSRAPLPAEAPPARTI